MQFYNARISRLEKGLVEISTRSRQEYTQQDGYVHAGALVTLADSAGGYATLSLLPAGSRVPTIQLKLNFLRPASGTIIRGRGHVKKIGRTISVVEVEARLKDGRNWATCAWGSPDSLLHRAKIVV